LIAAGCGDYVRGLVEAAVMAEPREGAPV